MNLFCLFKLYYLAISRKRRIDCMYETDEDLFSFTPEKDILLEVFDTENEGIKFDDIDYDKGNVYFEEITEHIFALESREYENLSLKDKLLEKRNECVECEELNEKRINNIQTPLSDTSTDQDTNDMKKLEKNILKEHNYFTIVSSDLQKIKEKIKNDYNIDKIILSLKKRNIFLETQIHSKKNQSTKILPLNPLINSYIDELSQNQKSFKKSNI